MFGEEIEYVTQPQIEGFLQSVIDYYQRHNFLGLKTCKNR